MQGCTLGQACKESMISEQSYYYWRKEHGVLDFEWAKRVKDLKRENARSKRSVADLSVQNMIPRASTYTSATEENLWRPIVGQSRGKQRYVLTVLISPQGR